MVKSDSLKQPQFYAKIKSNVLVIRLFLFCLFLYDLGHFVYIYIYIVEEGLVGHVHLVLFDYTTFCLYGIEHSTARLAILIIYIYIYICRHYPVVKHLII